MYTYTYDGGMTVHLLPRNTRVDPVRVGWMIDAENKKTLELIARKHSLSASALLDVLAVHLRDSLNEKGELSWLPTTVSKDEQLPIAS